MKKIMTGWFLEVLEVAKVDFNVSKLLFSQVPTLKIERQAVVTLKIHSTGLDRLDVTHF